MVAPEDAPAQHTPDNTGGTFGKLKQTLSSSLLTAQDKGNRKIFVVFAHFSSNALLHIISSSLFCLNLRMLRKN